MADDGNMSIEDLIKAIKTMSKDDQNKIKSKIGDEDSTKSRKDFLDHNEAQQKALIRQNELLAETAELLGDTVVAAEQRVKQGNREIEQTMERLNLGKGVKNSIREMLEDYREFGQLDDDALSTLQEQNPELQKLIKTQQERIDLEEGLNSIRGDGIPLIENAGKLLGLQAKYSQSAFGQMASLMKKFAEGGKEAKRAMMALKRTIKDTFSPKNIALNVFNAIKDNSIELFGAFDKAQAALAAATGQGDKFRGTLYEVGRQGNLFGVSMDDAGRAIGTMVDQTSNFTSMSKAMQADLALNVAKMEKLGVATTDSAQIFQNFNQALGMTADESMKMQTELAMAGVSIGVNAAKMTKDFNASLSTLMVYGRESVDVFKGIAAAAKAAGVETSTLLSIAGKFDTFSGAAEGAGKLNALLGTQLSTTEMLMATEDERIRMLVESVQSQGVAFKDMDRFTQKAIANAAGITDMAEANRIFGMSLDAYDENERKLNASADAQKKLDDAVAKTVPVMDQFKKLGAEMVVALEPFLETLESGAKMLTDFFKSMDTEQKEMLATFVSAFAGLVLIWPILKLAFAGFSLFGSTILPAVGLGASAAATGMGAAGTAATAATAPVAGFATALGAVAIEVVLIIGVVALLAAAMAGMYFGIAAIAEAIGGIFNTVLTGITTVVAAIKGSNEETAQFEARAAEAMATIVSGNHEGALSSIKSMVEEVNKMGQDVQVSSTIENLALITAGKASSMTGERVTASQTNVTANVQNFFEGMEMTLQVDGANFKAYVAKVANGEPT